MKNIHVLPTDKPSRLAFIHDKLYFDKEEEHITSSSQNIYITNDEEIKEGDWVVEITTSPRAPYIGKTFYPKNDGTVTEEDLKKYLLSVNYKDHYETTAHKGTCSKIILTDNTDLIKDGIQAIDDEFLEWFVKNPSCEFVEVEHSYVAIKVGKPSPKVYNIIIPNEEPKQSIILDLIFYEDEEGQKDVEIDWSGFPKSTQEQVGYVEPKQETLEEVAERLTKDFPHYSVRENMDDSDIKGWFLEALNIGAKWQQQQNNNLYSEEEVLEHLNHLIMMPSSKLDEFTDDEEKITLKWFEQFKKK